MLGPAVKITKGTKSRSAKGNRDEREVVRQLLKTEPEFNSHWTHPLANGSLLILLYGNRSQAMILSMLTVTVKVIR